MIITEIRKTCEACPSQWEGKFDDGDSMYIRYRWGYLSICKGNPNENEWKSIAGMPEIFGKQIGDKLDGCIDLHEVLSVFGLELQEGVVEEE